MAEIADIIFTIDRSWVEVSNANGLFDTINTRYYVRRGMQQKSISCGKTSSFITIHSQVRHADQQVSINRFFGQALAGLVSCVIGGCSRSLPGAQVVTLGLL